MKLFALGALWAFYAMFVFAVSQVYIGSTPDRHFSVESSLDIGTRHEMYLRSIDEQCASWTKLSMIFDYSGGGAKYSTECSSTRRAVTLNVLAGLLILMPVSLVAIILKKRAKANA